MFLKNFMILLFILSVFNANEAAKILGLFTAPARSHNIIHESLMLRLAEMGHEVTIINSFNLSKKNPPKTLRQILIPFEQAKNDEITRRMLKNAQDGESSNFWDLVGFMRTIADRHEDSFYDPRVMELKEKETFDLVYIGWFVSDVQIGLAAHFKCPAVMASTGPPSIMTRNLVGNPSGTSHSSSPFYKVIGPMNFKQRTINFLVNLSEYFIITAVDYFFYEPRYAKHFPSDKYPSFSEARKNISLVLVNHHFSQGAIEAYLPAYVEVGGMHIPTKPNPLPKDIQDFLDGAIDGAVYFSLGSNARSDLITPDKRDAMVRVFSRLKQRVIWKFEDELPNKPDNLMIGKWFPQSDILAHPNIRLFISHCGFGGVTEAKFNGVPILGLPVYGDQPANLENIVEQGWAVSQSLASITEEGFSNAVHEILTNQSYRNTVKKISELFHDRPQTAMDRATYWIEYVIRHKGAKHMQSPAVHLNIFQYHSLDVLGFLLVGIYVIWKIIKFSFCFIFRKCQSNKKVKKE